MIQNDISLNVTIRENLIQIFHEIELRKFCKQYFTIIYIIVIWYSHIRRNIFFSTFNKMELGLILNINILHIIKPII